MGEKVGNEHVVENHELKEKIWKGIDRKNFSLLVVIFYGQDGQLRAALVGVMFLLGI